MIIESKVIFNGSGRFAHIKGLVKQVLEHLPGPVRVGIGNGGFVGGFVLPKVK